mgnify:FL=1
MGTGMPASEPVLDTLRIPQDVPGLYKLMEGEDQYLFSTTVQHQTADAFGSWLEHMVATSFNDFRVVRLAPGAEPVGYVHDYDFRLRDGHCRIAVCIDPSLRATGVGAIAAIRFVAMLFNTYPLRKVYSTVYDYNKESLRTNLAAGFVDEGTLEDFRYYDGDNYALHYLSLDRQTFERRFGGRL